LPEIKVLAEVKVYQALVAIDKCLSVTANIKVRMVEDIYDRVCELKIMCGVQVW
jgi:hypothetical protein